MSHEEKRLQRLQSLDDHIGRALRESEASGELRSAPSWGKPIDYGDGYERTPTEWRLAYKMLKDAGVVPPEVEMLRALAGLRGELESAAGDADRERALRARIAALRLAIAFRLEAIRGGSGLRSRGAR